MKEFMKNHLFLTFHIFYILQFLHLKDFISFCNLHYLCISLTDK